MGSDQVMVLLVIVIVTALAFDFTNGFHDTANAMATSIATRALKPRPAVALSAVLNLAGAFISLKVATTISQGIVDSSLITLDALLAGLIGAIAWNLVTWYLGLPSSSTHALIGGLVGAAIVSGGFSAVKVSALVGKVIVPALASPLIAAVVAVLGTFLAYKVVGTVSQRAGERGYRYGQIGSASLVSLAHGTNDAQKTMGVITLALIVHGSIAHNASTPPWVIVLCAVAIGLGTYIGGWRIIRTLGHKLTDVQSPQGFAAESSGASVLLASSYFGYPLSTTHIVSGAVMGSGIGKRLAAVRWGLAGRIVLAWVVTLPCAALVGAGANKAIQSLGTDSSGPIVMAVVAAMLAALLVWTAQRKPVTATDV